MDVLIGVYVPGVYLSEVKVKYYLFFFVNQLLFFIIESIDAFYFVNNVVYKDLLIKERGSKVVYKIFIVVVSRGSKVVYKIFIVVVSMHLSAT